MEPDGIHWTAGSLLTPGSQIHGSFFLPWNVIVGIELKDIPGKINAIGGALLIKLHGGPHLYGEFLGSRNRMKQAIEKSPV